MISLNKTGGEAEASSPVLHQKRLAGWGQRSNHPLSQAWRQTRRNVHGRALEWDDFWRFVSDVGEKPDPRSLLRRKDLGAAYGPANFFWSTPIMDTPLEADNKRQRAEYAKQWRRRNPILSKQSDLKKHYGISIADYTAMLEAQGGGCAICGQRDKWFSLAVDHCHNTNKIRGLLCSQCNRGIGLFRDEPERLEMAAAYLRGKL